MYFISGIWKKNFSLKRSAWLVTVVLLCFSCGNEPYKTGTISVSAVNEKGTSVARSFTYRKGRVRQYKSIISSITSISTFYYVGDQLSRIVKDSTELSYTVVHIVNEGILPIKDSTVVYSSLEPQTIARKYFEYDAEGNLSAQVKQALVDNAWTETRFTYTWSEGNLIETSVYQLVSGVTEWKQTYTVQFDGKENLYNSKLIFLYTLLPEEVYLLSANNPVVVTPAEGTVRRYRYVYNKFGYPASYIFLQEPSKGANVSYTELR